MKNAIFLPSLWFVFNLLLIGTTSAQWTSVETGTTNDFCSICQGDDNRLCCSGLNGTIILSDDAGESWYPASIGTNETVYHISMLGQTGYAVADEGAVFNSSDNGLSWSEVYNTGSKLRCLFVLSPSRFYFGGQYELLWEANHGSWNPIPYITGPGYWFRDIHFPDGQSGYAVGDGGRAYKTPNSGYGWFLMNTQTDNHLQGVYFPSPDTGYCVGFGSTILKTTDGGINWQNIYSGTANNFRSAFFHTNDCGFVSGEEGTILRTEDGGQTWITEETDITQTLKEFCYIPEMDRLLVCGFEGIILYKDLVTRVNETSSHHDTEVKVDINPNPFNHSFNLEISGLQNKEYNLLILGSRNEKVREVIGIQNGRLEIDAQGMPSGANFYQIISKGRSIASGKLIKK